MGTDSVESGPNIDPIQPPLDGAHVDPSLGAPNLLAANLALAQGVAKGGFESVSSPIQSDMKDSEAIHSGSSAKDVGVAAFIAAGESGVNINEFTQVCVNFDDDDSEEMTQAPDNDTKVAEEIKLPNYFEEPAMIIPSEGSASPSGNEVLNRRPPSYNEPSYRPISEKAKDSNPIAPAKDEALKIKSNPLVLPSAPPADIAGVDSIQGREDVKVSSEDYSNLRGREDEVFNKFLDLVFGENRHENLNQLYLESGSNFVEKRIDKLVRRAYVDFDQYKKLGFKDPQQVSLFLEHMKERFIFLGTQRERECREREVLAANFGAEAIIDAELSGEGLKAEVNEGKLIIDGRPIDLGGEIEYTGIKFSELKEVAREYIQELVEGKVDDYDAAYLAPSKEMVDRGEWAGMGIVSLKYHKELRQKFFEGQRISLNDLKNTQSEDQKDFQSVKVEFSWSNTKEGSVHDFLERQELKIGEMRKARSKELFQRIEAEIKNRSELREFRMKLLESLLLELKKMTPQAPGVF